MPQLGLHLIVGTAGGPIATRRANRLALGFLVGSVLPDLDFLLVVPIRLFDRELALSLHRSFSHSLIFVGSLMLAALLILLAGRGRRRPTTIGYLVTGIGLGAAVHVALDLVFWFDAVRILWPDPRGIYLYGNFSAPAWLRNATAAVEISCYGLFLLYVADRLRRPRRVRQFAWLMCIGGIPLLAAAPFVPVERFELVAYGVAIILGFAPAVILAWPLLARLSTATAKENL